MTCSVEGCTSPIAVKSRQLCRTHYYRWRVHGDPVAGRVSPNPDRECSVDGCKGRGRIRGYCDKHYKRWLMHGDPLAVLPPHRRETKDFWQDVSVGDPDECWEWQLGRTKRVWRNDWRNSPWPGGGSR